MILILSARDDGTAERVAGGLSRRGAEVAWLDPGDAPAALQIAMRYERGRPRLTLSVGGRRCDLAGVGVAWYWRPSRVAPPEAVRDELMRGYCAAETAHALDDLWHALPCAWVPGPPAAIRRAEYKFAQLGAACRAGFEAPDTLTTNDPEAFFAFRADHPGAVIAKPAGPSLLRQPGQPQAGYMKASGYTALVSRGDLGYASAIRHAPVTFQPYVEKRSEIRATVIGEQVFAVEIDSQANHRTRIDWRRYDRGHTPYRAHRLPEAIERSCLALARGLGLRYGAIDLILTPEGRYVFLEVNPNGQFGWLEESTGLPLHDALCDLLAGLDRPDSAQDGGL